MLSYPSKSLFALLTAFLMVLGVQAQEEVRVERSSNKVILEGKVYYIHMVEAGQTLYAIARAYHVSEKEIAVENPGAMSGLRVGQVLKIPVETAMDEGIDTSKQDHQGKHTHKVKRGETFYGIARMYGIDEEALGKANPGVGPENLKPGMRLLIPEPSEEEPEQSAENTFNEEGFAYHKVKRKETLYSIGRYYGVSVQDIRAANPELGWGGPKTGQVIRIPLPQVMDHPESARDTLSLESNADTLFMEDVEEYFYDDLISSHDNRRRVYRIAYFIPFDFEIPEPLDSLLKDVEAPGRRARITERYRMEQAVPQSVPFLEFFQGSLLALDSLRQAGMRMEVSFHDTEKSMSRMEGLLSEPGMDDVDLIIGPFYRFNLEIVEGFARRNRIPMVTPFFNEKAFIWDNPYLFQPSPSLEEGYKELAKLVASKHMYNIVYVRDEDSLDVEKHALLQEMIFDGFDDYRPVEPVIFKEMVLTLEHSDEIIHSLSGDRKNLVVVPTRNEALASRVVSALYYRLNDYEIEVVGTPYWTEFSSINYRYYHDLQLTFYSAFWMDYLDPSVEEFMRRYRAHFYAEPGAMTRKGINYGIAGFDMTLYFANAMKVYGQRFILKLDEYHPRLVLGTYDFKRVNSGGGYENTRIPFYQFLPDKTIVRIKVPELPRRGYDYRSLDNHDDSRLIYDQQH